MGHATEHHEPGGDGDDHRTPKLFEPPATLEAVPHRREQYVPSRPPTGSRHQPQSPASLAAELHPRERLVHAGPEALSAAELLAAILGGEPKRSLELAGELISSAGSLAALRSARYHDLTRGDTASLSQARACSVLATIELGKRLAAARTAEPVVISRAEHVHELMNGRMRDLDREHFVAVLLDTRNQVLDTPTISVGTALSAQVHPREVFRPAIRASADSLILVHNHPSGQPEPSREDRQVTERLARVAEELGIEVTDHVIVAGDEHVSLKQRGAL